MLFSNRSRGDALRGVDAVGCLCSLRARRRLMGYGAAWLKSQSAMVLPRATESAPSSAPSLGRRSLRELDAVSCLVD
jgi:hypothetical protein